MSVEIHAIQRIRAWSETTFGSDGTGTLGNFTDLPIREGSAQLTLTIDSIDPQQIVQSIHEYREEVLGKRSATIAFTLNLAPTGTAAVTGTSSITSGLGIVLKAAMGGQALAAGSTSSTGSTATVVNVQAGHGSRWAAGKAMGWVNSLGNLEVREVESVSTDAITIKHAFSGSPVSTNALYNCATYYFTENPTESLQFIVEGYENEDRWLLLGGQCVGGMTIALDPTGQALPSITFNFSFASFKYSSETSGSLSGTLAAATYTGFEPIVGHVGEFRVFTVGASTLVTSSTVHCSALAFAPAVSYVAVTSPSGVQTVKQWRLARAAPRIEGSFTTFFEDATWFTARDGKADKAVFYQAGVTAGSTFLLSAPTVQVVNPQRVADASGIAGQNVPWKGRRDTDVGVSTAEIAKSPFRIHLA